MDSSICPVVPPAVRVTAIVADGNAHVATPPWVKVNFTGTTPRLTLKTLVPSALIGCCTCAAYVAMQLRNKIDTLFELTLPTARSCLPSLLKSPTATERGRPSTPTLPMCILLLPVPLMPG